MWVSVRYVCILSSVCFAFCFLLNYFGKFLVVCLCLPLSCRQKTSVVFTNNRAEVAGAAIYANDMSRCQWVGSECGLEDKRTNISRTTIFDLVADCSPFKFSNNTVGESLRGQVVNPVLATDPRNISAKSNVSRGEIVEFWTLKYLKKL